MLSKKLEKALNEQINLELASSYLYLSMAAYAESVTLPGFANWFMLQAKEESDHAMKIYNFINERGGRVMLLGIAEPKNSFKSPVALFEEVLAHERG